MTTLYISQSAKSYSASVNYMCAVGVVIQASKIKGNGFFRVRVYVLLNLQIYFSTDLSLKNINSEDKICISPTFIFSVCY